MQHFTKSIVYLYEEYRNQSYLKVNNHEIESTVYPLGFPGAGR